jgi:nitroimidazol reductase NimA-like FMN-containing flavoprotein (pyridoxamine 5'-phosphate oxidase superfamily)
MTLTPSHTARRHKPRRKGDRMTRDQIIDYIRDVKFGYLATADADGAPRVRPIGITTVYGDDLYFFTFSTTRKVAEMEANPRVEVVWSKLEQVTQVRVSGTDSAAFPAGQPFRRKGDSRRSR